MSEAALEEVSALSSIYCGQGEFQLLRQSAEDGLLVQISCAVGGERGLDVSLLFHLHPSYPSCPPDISVSSTKLSRSQCNNIRTDLLEQAAALAPEPMVYQLVQWLQCKVITDNCRGHKEEVGERDEEEWTAVLLLDHIRSRNCYVGLLERWARQLQLTGRVLLGRIILIVLQGAKPDIKEFCCLLKTVKVDVDSSGKKCKERMMKVLIEAPLPSSGGQSLQGFIVQNYQSLPELAAAFQDLHMSELYQKILPSLGS
ncbi:RWD domain-containing protein 3 [Mastacembelus armatus]|uniref:RWD domain-containing protein 3 n=1 Tax=Mastacembelus armatus TaxID=205130 RepID=A0A3Q3N192_9TELE|nr:RWD domain-containing protein 3 [Mastacembelus armatus]XP_026189587.1 RWD domain-containing protein 3 [Mastacembelus armatus]XP_026189588.1 RWD domain-containing protein 3 [Mastacembelus armatus]